MTEEIEQISPEEVTSAILSYSDPNLVTGLFEQLGWSPSAEIIETLYIARQNVNLAAKLSAIKYLRQLVRESAEAAGLIGTVSKTVHGRDGSHTTFSARNMATALNPKRKQIKIKEIKNVEQRTEETVDGGSSGKKDGREGDNSPPTNNTKETGNTPSGGPDRGRDRGAGVGGSENGDHNVESGNSAGGAIPIDKIFETRGDHSDADGEGNEYEQPPREGATDNPCVEHRPPTCDRELYPGVSGALGGDKGGEDN